MNQDKRKNEIWVWIEHHQGEPASVSLGLINKAKELCLKLGDGVVAALVVGDVSETLAKTVITYGADKVYLVQDPSLSLFDSERCSEVVKRLAQEYQPEVLLWGATSLGREIAARAAARLKTGLTAHCVELCIENIAGQNQLVATVAGWVGNLMIRILCPRRRPQMATVNPGIFSPKLSPEHGGKIEHIKMDTPSRLEIMEVFTEPEETASIEQAKVIVAGGWGMNAMGGFTPVAELAQVLGAAVGGTRPAVDAGWIPHERMIGQSGKTVAPQLLITLGVSGAAQFATGITRTKFILAIDKNPRAPIFEMADPGIVGDVKEVLPLLIQRLKELKQAPWRGRGIQ